MSLKQTKTCSAHGFAEVLSSVFHEHIRHDHLSCGCTLESECISEGDLVLHNGSIFRVDFVTREGIANIKNCNEAHFTSLDTLKFVGKDTISKLVCDSIPLKVEVGDIVSTVTVDGELLGKVIAVYGGSVRCRFLDPVDSEVKTDLWRIARVETVSSAFLRNHCICGDTPHDRDCPLVVVENSYLTSDNSDMLISSDYRRTNTGNYYSRSNSTYNGEYPSYVPKIARPLQDKPKPPKPDGYGISTAELIKEEVRTLNAKKSTEDFVPAKTSGKRDIQDIVESVTPVAVSKRKNSW